jgi:hypothetical protein
MAIRASREHGPGIVNRHCEPTGRANARPMTGSAKIPWGVDSDQV